MKEIKDPKIQFILDGKISRNYSGKEIDDQAQKLINMIESRGNTKVTEFKIKIELIEREDK